jgi:hypothetical protein
MPNIQRHTSGIAIVQAQSGRPTLFISGQRVDVLGGQAQLVPNFTEERVKRFARILESNESPIDDLWQLAV